MAEGKRTRKANRESTVYLGSDGFWHGRIVMGYNSDGSVDRRHVMRKNEEDARKQLDKLTKERDSGAKTKPGRVPTVAQWMETYLDTIAVRTLARRSYDDYWSKTRNWIIPCVGKHRLDRLEPDHLDEMYAKMERAGKSQSHVLKVHRILSRALKVARRRRKIAVNVAELVDPPVVDEVERDDLSAEEAKKVLAAAESLRNGARWSVALAVGLRQGEALGLRWSCINLETGDVKVHWQLQRLVWRHGCDDPHACGQRLHRTECPANCKRHKNPAKCVRNKKGHPRPCPKGCTRHASSCPQRQGGGLVLRRPKGKSKREITLPKPLMALLRRHKIAQDAEREVAGEQWAEQDFVFTNPDGSPLDPREDWEDWGELTRRAGVREVRLHDGRHTAGTLLVEQGVHIRVVQRILGHSDVRTTQGYAHAGDAMVRDAAERMGSALWDDGN